jgi:hypothetical protein
VTSIVERPRSVSAAARSAFSSASGVRGRLLALAALLPALGLPVYHALARRDG